MNAVLDESLLFFLCFLAQRGENTDSGLVCVRVSHEATCWSSSDVEHSTNTGKTEGNRCGSV